MLGMGQVISFFGVEQSILEGWPFWPIRKGNIDIYFLWGNLLTTKGFIVLYERTGEWGLKQQQTWHLAPITKNMRGELVDN